MIYKKLLIGFFFIGAISMIVMTMHYYLAIDSGILKNKDIGGFSLYHLFFYSHITGGLIAITLGPFQLIQSVIKRKRLHRVMGYTYSTAVFVSSLTGLVIAQFAMGGIITTLGFSLLSVVWLVTLIGAILEVKNGNIQNHNHLMKVNYALTFSSITQRTILLFAFIPGLNFIPVYQSSAWFSWLFNLLIIFIIIKRKKNEVSIATTMGH